MAPIGGLKRWLLADKIVSINPHLTEEVTSIAHCLLLPLRRTLFII